MVGVSVSLELEGAIGVIGLIGGLESRPPLVISQIQFEPRGSHLHL